MFGVKNVGASGAFFRRRVGILLAVVMAAVLPAGCGGDKGAQPGGEVSSAGDYKRYDISQIEGLGFVYSLSRTGGGLIALGDNDEGKLYRYTSEDDGVTWSGNELATGASASDDSAGSTLMVKAADMDADGKAVVGYVELDAQANIRSCSIWSEATGKSASIDTENISGLICSADGAAVYVYDGGSVGRYELAGTAKGSDGTVSEAGKDTDSAGGESYVQSYAIDTGSVLDFCEMDSELLVLTENELVRYDSGTGEKNGAYTDFMSALESSIQETAGKYGMEAGNCHRVMRVGDDGKLYFMLEDGFYSCDTGSDLVTRLVGKESGEWKDDTTVMFDFAVNVDGEAAELTALCSGEDARQLVGYSANEMAVSPESGAQAEDEAEKTEITVYSLYNEGNMDYLILEFNKKYPNIEVNYECGIPELSGVTASDAVKTLNTQLLAGEGPDVILMDGLDVQRYADAGLLLDLTDAYNEILETYPNCLQNVMSAYKTDDGIYAIPSRAQCVGLIAPEESIDGLTDIASIIDYIKNSEEPKMGNDLGLYTWEQVFESLYPAFASDIVDTKGNYSEENLRAFLSDMKELTDLLVSRSTEEEIQESESALKENFVDGCNKDVPNFAYTLWGSTQPLFFREESGHNIAVNYIANSNGLEELYSLRSYKVDGETMSQNDLQRKVLESRSGKEFVAALAGAVSASSGHADEAKLFVRELLSTEVQTISASNGVSINMDSYGTDMENTLMGDNYGHTVVYEWTYPDDKVDDIEGFLSELDILSNSNSEIHDMIKSGLESYAEGEKTLDEAVSDTGAALKLYLSE